MAAAAWLAEKAKSYYRDAERLEGEAQVGDMTGAQWATVYRAVAEELKACAREHAKSDEGPHWIRTESAGEPPRLDLYLKV